MTDLDREAMEVDVVIVGAGPAGLSAAIRLKQLDPDLNVVVLEKGSEVGAHILSGAVVDPSGLNALIPDWREKGAPLNTARHARTGSSGWARAGGIRLPNFMMPRLMNNHGNYIVSLGNVCRWLAEQAEALGVEIYPGMSCSELVYGEDDRVIGVVAGEFGKRQGGQSGPELRARHDRRRQIRAAGRGRARLALQGGDREIRALGRRTSRRNTASA